MSWTCSPVNHHFIPLIYMYKLFLTISRCGKCSAAVNDCLNCCLLLYGDEWSEKGTIQNRHANRGVLCEISSEELALSKPVKRLLPLLYFSQRAHMKLFQKSSFSLLDFTLLRGNFKSQHLLKAYRHMIHQQLLSFYMTINMIQVAMKICLKTSLRFYHHLAKVQNQMGLLTGCHSISLKRRQPRDITEICSTGLQNVMTSLDVSCSRFSTCSLVKLFEAQVLNDFRPLL